MRTIHLRRRLGAAITALGLSVGLVALAPSASADPVDPGLSCSGSNLIVKTLESGSAWAMCVSIHTNKGLVLEQISFKATRDDTYRRVLDSFYLSQLNVPYDTGENVWDDLTSYGFGNQYLQKLSSKECPTGDLIDVHQNWTRRSTVYDRTIPAICVAEEGTGVSYRSHEQVWGSPADSPLYVGQGSKLTISSVSKVDWYEYMERIDFHDEGTITANLGATGDISYEDFADGSGVNDTTTGWPVGQGATDYAASHWHNAIWRADFGIDNKTDQKVERYDTTYTGVKAATGSKGEILKTAETDVTHAASFGAKGSGSDDELTWYRIVSPSSLNTDQHSRSYEINMQKVQRYGSSPVTQPQITFTNNNPCQEYASSNLNTACKNQSIVNYVANDTGPLTDPVAWINVGFHHIIRDEDQSPMPTHWQSFDLVARDFTAQSPATPAARECINGDPGGELHSACIAPPSLTKPIISGVAEAGSELTVSNGTWNQTNLSYGYQWLRGGLPIADATTATYTTTAEDAGTVLTVDVTATSTKSSLATTVTSEPLAIAKPIASTLPAITGTLEPGGTLTVSDGTWNLEGLTFGYLWKRDGQPIAGADQATYVAKAGDSGKPLTAVVTATKAGVSGTAESLAVTVDGPQVLTAPRVTGTAKLGGTLAVSTGTWNLSGLTFGYQWYRGTTPIAGAKAATYHPVVADAGLTLKAVVTATKADASNPATSNAVTVAKAASRTTASLAAKKVKRAVHGRVTVKVTSVVVPTGKVEVLRRGKVIARGTLVSGSKGAVRIVLPKLAVGKHTLKVRYAGSTRVAGSTGPTVVLKVVK